MYSHTFTTKKINQTQVNNPYMEHLAVGYRWFQRCFMFNPDIGGLMIPTLTCANTTCNMGVEKSANLWSFEPGNLGKCPFTLSVDNPWFKRISRCWKYDGHRNAGVSNFQKNLNLFAVFLLPQGGRCWPITLSYMFFCVFSLCSPKWANKNTSKCNMEVIPSQSKCHLRPKTSTHKVPFFRRNPMMLWPVSGNWRNLCLFSSSSFSRLWRFDLPDLPWNHGWVACLHDQWIEGMIWWRGVPILNHNTFFCSPASISAHISV